MKRWRVRNGYHVKIRDLGGYASGTEFEATDEQVAGELHKLEAVTAEIEEPRRERSRDDFTKALGGPPEDRMMRAR